MTESPAGVGCDAQNEAENRRVAYVGLTRARDALVLAVPANGWKDTSWIRSFKGDYLLPNGDALALPGEKSIRTASATLEATEDAANAVAFEPRRFPERAPLAGTLRETVLPSATLAAAGASAGETVTLGERIAIRGEDMTLIGTALHAVIAAELANPGRADRVERTRTLLEGYGVGAFLGAEDALAPADRLRAWIERRFAPRKILTEHPVVHALPDGRVVRGWVDVLVETGAGWVVIDHKSSPRPRAEWTEEVLGYSGQVEVYRNALDAAGRKTIGAWVHFAVGGGLVEVLPGNR